MLVVLSLLHLAAVASLARFGLQLVACLLHLPCWPTFLVGCTRPFTHLPLQPFHPARRYDVVHFLRSAGLDLEKASAEVFQVQHCLPACLLAGGRLAPTSPGAGV